jgi:hypothetical protein
VTREEVMARIAAGEFVTTNQAVKRLGPDVTAERIRDWGRRPDVDVTAVRDPDGKPVRVPARRGVQNVWLWRELVAAEAQTALSGRGRRRTGGNLVR